MRSGTKETTTARRRAIVVAVVASVALAGIATVAVSARSVSPAGAQSELSSQPGKVVTPTNGTVCPLGYEPANETNETNASGYQLRVLSDENWTVEIVTGDDNYSTSSSDNKTIAIDADEDERVVATVTQTNLTNESDPVTARLVRDGATVDRDQQRTAATVDNLATNNGSATTSVDDDANDTSVNVSSTDADTNVSGYALDITGNGSWAANITTDEADIDTEGSGNETIEIDAGEGDNVRAVVAKTGFENGSVDAELLLDGEVVDEAVATNAVLTDEGTDSTTGTDDSLGTESTVSSSSDNDTTLATTNADEEAGTFGNDGDDTDNGASEDEGDAIETTSDSSVDPFSEEDSFEANASNGNESDETNATAADTEDDADTRNESEVPDNCVPVDAENETSINTTANVTFSDQGVGDYEGAANTNFTLVVDEATLPEGGFVVIHNMTIMQSTDGAIEDSVVGVSGELNATQENEVVVNLADEIEENQTLVAVVYRDSDGNGDFNYEEDGSAIDEPYQYENGTVVSDEANVTVASDADANSTATNNNAFGEETDTAEDGDVASVFGESDTATATSQATSSTDNPTSSGPSSTADSPTTAVTEAAAAQTTQANAPGFGIGVAIIAMLGVALIAARVR